MPSIPGFSRRRLLATGPIVVGLLVTFFMVFGLRTQPFLQDAELTTYDWQFQQRGAVPSAGNIVVVGVDAASISDFNGRPAIPRVWAARAITYLTRAGAAVIASDFLYKDPSLFNRSSTVTQDDDAFVRALRQSGRVVVVQELNGAISSNYVGASASVTPPLDRIARAVARVGVANYPVDTDGVVRQAELVQLGQGGSFANARYPIFPVQIASLYLKRPVADVVRGLPNELYINYVGPQGVGDNSVQSWPLVQFEGVARGEDNPALFRNKIVLIVPAALDFKDQLNTPFGQMYGGFVQANTLNTILRRNPIVPAGDGVNILILLIVGLATTAAASRFGIWRSTAATLLLAVGYSVLAILLFRGMRVWIDLITPEAGIVLAYGFIMAFRFATEERLKRKTSRAFGLYLRPEVVNLLVESEDPTRALAPRRRDISVLFVDIRGFTAMSEHMRPEDVVATLDVYLEELTDAVQASGGTLNKYVGDEIMAMWNTPVDQPDHARRAVACALDMVERIDRINGQLQLKGQPQVSYGIGLNSGEAVVGQMGSTFRKQFDVIGDTVNTAARLCSAAGRMETIIGQGTWEAVGDRLVVEETDPLRLKGKSETIRTFQLLSMLDSPAPTPAAAPAPA